METPDDAGDRKLSRRRFIKIAGGSLAAGTAALALGSVAAASPIPQGPETETKGAKAGATPSPLAESSASNPGDVLGEQAFSIFWITDTQFLSESNPAL